MEFLFYIIEPYNMKLYLCQTPCCQQTIQAIFYQLMRFLFTCHLKYEQSKTWNETAYQPKFVRLLTRVTETFTAAVLQGHITHFGQFTQCHSNINYLEIIFSFYYKIILVFKVILISL